MTQHGAKQSKRWWGRSVALILLIPEAALANNNPGPQTMFGFLALLVAIPLLTHLGGGETILARLRPASRIIRGFLGLLKVLAVLFCVVMVATAGTSGLALLCVLAYAVFRGARLLAWGVKARQPDGARPKHVAGASRWRLMTAGSLLIVTAMVLTHMSLAFVWYYPSESRVGSDLMRLATAMKAAGEKNRGADGLPRYTSPGVSSTGSYEMGREWYHSLSPEENALRGHFWHATEVRVAPDAKSFQAWAWPRKVPVWPWSRVMPVASYYIDQTGQLRMIRVSETGKRCPQDAPVYALASN